MTGDKDSKTSDTNEEQGLKIWLLEIAQCQIRATEENVGNKE